MPLSINFPDLGDMPRAATLFATPPPVWKRDAVADLARRAGVEGDVVDRGLWHVVQDDRASLEVYQASHSLRYGVLRAEGEPHDKEAIDESKARSIADEWVAQFGPRRAQYDIHSIAESELLVSRREGEEPERFVTALQVNYRFTLGELPLLGPGGKMQVGVDARGDITDAYRFWRDARPINEVRVMSGDDACERFARGALFSELSDDSARAEVTEIRLGYFAVSPTEAQMVLSPVYEFRGVLSTELHPHYEFISHVPAAAIDGVAVKRAGRPARAPEEVAS